MLADRTGAGVAVDRPGADRGVALDRPGADGGVDLPAGSAAAAAVLPASSPVRLRVPSIGVDTGLVALGLEADGSLEVPASASPAGWYTGGPTPGELGPSVVAGHVDLSGQPGVFADLADVQPGAEVLVGRADGTSAAFRVTRVQQVDKDAFPTAAVYGDLDHAGLRLITCGGAFSRSAGSYEDNVVVYAELVPTAAA